MSFFVNEEQLNGAKRSKSSLRKRKRDISIAKKINYDEIESSEDEGLDNGAKDSFSDDDKETAQEKKLRLAKLYLDEIKKEEVRREENHNVINKRLKHDYLKQVGKLRLTIANKLKHVDMENVKILKSREQKNCITCTCIASDDNYLFVGSKDGTLIKYSIFECKKIGVIPFVKHTNIVTGHCSKILSVAVSTDSKFLAVSDECNSIYVWDACTLKFIEKLKGHKNIVFGLSFKTNSHILYSCSKDRTVKVWNLEEMTYVETLFGHQDIITCVDSLYEDRVVTSGGRDVRVWKITEESQLIFNGHLGNIDLVKLINEDNFISGGDDGQLCVWSVMRKKPLCVIQNAHGINIANQQPYWISAIAPVINTDLVATGSHDGYIKLWKIDNNFKSISSFMQIPVDGFINSLNFTSDGSKLIVAVSKEHRLGRWSTVKTAKNCIMIVPFIKE